MDPAAYADHPLTDRERQLQREGFECWTDTRHAFLNFEPEMRKEARWMRCQGHRAEAVVVYRDDEGRNRCRLWTRLRPLEEKPSRAPQRARGG